MIKRLSIRNYVLIDQLDLDFDPGLTIVTGETGAGKSILLGALGLILGERAESGVLAREDEKALIEGVFAIREYGLTSFFSTHDLEYHDELILRREILPQGRSRAFINDSPASLQILRELGRKLIDVHQQFDQLDVLEEDFQINMLDALAAQIATVDEYTRKFKSWKQDLDRLEKMKLEEANSEQERSFLQFQVEELLAAGLQPGESEALEQEAKTLRHATEIRQVLEAAHSLILDGEVSPIDQLNVLTRSVHPLRNLHSGVEQLADRLESVRIELEDLAKEIESLADRIEADPARLLEVETRLNGLNKLLLKHHVPDSETLIERMKGIEEKLEGLEGRQAEIEALQASILQQEAELQKSADQISSARIKASKPFEAKMMRRLEELGMGGMRLAFQVEQADGLKWNGRDRISFLMAQQEGARLAPVRQAASGGELSRLTLVIKSLVAAAIPLPSLVFDEIDAGVSGAVSMKMGDLLTRMAQEHQLIVITHSPQIAARANCHFYVSKAPEQGEVRTRVTPLLGEDRVKAIAIMLSTDPPSPSALANARELVAAE